MSVPMWSKYYLGIAESVSKRSNCLRAQVGCVIVAKNNRIVATGYNGTPSKVESCKDRGFCYRKENKIPSGTQYETCRSIHAEMNAIIQAGKDLCEGSNLYLFGHQEVCMMCKRFIIQAGINMVYLKKDSKSKQILILPEEWGQCL